MQQCNSISVLVSMGISQGCLWPIWPMDKRSFLATFGCNPTHARTLQTESCHYSIMTSLSAVTDGTWGCRRYSYDNSCWRHQMETFSALLAICAGNSPVTGEFPAQRPVTRTFCVFFDLRLNKRLSKQSWVWWFDTLSRPLWRHHDT